MRNAFHDILPRSVKLGNETLGNFFVDRQPTAGGQMRWKAFLVCGFALCIVSGAVSSFAAEAQSPAEVYRIGWLSPFVNANLHPGTILGGNRGTFIRALNDLGYVKSARRNRFLNLRDLRPVLVLSKCAV